MSKKRHAGPSGKAGQFSGPHDRPTSRRGRAGNRSIWLWIGGAIVVVAVAAFLLMRPQQAQASEITAAQAYAKYQSGAFFLDVRTQAEYDQGHIAKSVLIPLDELPNRLSEVPREQDIVVVCKSGPRSKEGGAILLKAGYTRVSCLSGGLQAWTAAGYTLEQ